MLHYTLSLSIAIYQDVFICVMVKTRPPTDDHGQTLNGRPPSVGTCLSHHDSFPYIAIHPDTLECFRIDQDVVAYTRGCATTISAQLAR